MRDVLFNQKVSLYIPRFLNGRDKFNPQEEAKTNRIAKLRIHAKRAKERVKKFRLLQITITLNLTPVINQMVFVACCLENFQEPIVK